MKKIIFCLLLMIPFCVFAQIGIKAGLNFANVTNAKSINSSSSTGFHAGILLAPPSQKIFGFRTELTYSKQGYDYKSGTNSGTVDLNYIMSSNLTCINITKYFQIQFGAQMAYLLNAKVDSTTNTSTGNPQVDKIMNLYNRFDYGFAGGVEVHPVGGLLIGARANISLGSLYKDAQSGQMPSFSNIDIKNNVFQVFVGWRFGKQPESSKKKDKKEKKEQ
ncbi:MAG: porin family protein [Chitinophagaceae bacterium]